MSDLTGPLEPAGPEDNYWRVIGCQFGVVHGMHPSDDRISTLVSLTFDVQDLPGKPARFVMSPDEARAVADSLVTAADRVDREQP